MTATLERRTDRALTLAADMLDGADGSSDLRVASLNRNHDPLDLAVELDPDLVATPALRLIAAALERAITVPGTRVAISIPPQEGKTTLVQHAFVRKLQRDPSRRNALVQYNSDLATDTGLGVRTLIDRNGSRAVDQITGEQLPDALGLAVAPDRAAGGNWRLASHPGGLYSIGVGGGLTGRPVDGLFVVDDPYKDMSDADSEATRKRVWSHWTSVAEARFVPETSVVVVHTRWHEDDLIGKLEAADKELPEDLREWEFINVPALADGQTPDSLGRAVGEWLRSARDRTVEHWQAIRRRVGERVFAAEYQGRPAPLKGGIFQQDWIENSRVTEAPDLDAIELGVDPADTGKSDAAGMIVGGRARDGQLYILADLSGQLSQGQYARRACLAVVRWGVNAIVQERTLGMQSAVRDAWSVIRRQAAALVEHADVDDDATVAAAVAALAGPDPIAAKEDQLHEVLPRTDAILGLPPDAPCRIVTVTPKQSKKARADGITNGYELATTHHVGTLPLLEHEMVTWQEGQASPNRLDTLAHLVTHLDIGRFETVASRGAARPGGGLPTRTSANPRRAAGSTRTVTRTARRPA